MNQTPEQVQMQVMASASNIADRAMSQLSSEATELHNLGYHAFSAAMSNMRSKIERAMYELADEIEVT